ncbi:MAG: hypothetical protein A3F74_16275 [Betaproteobacteria bacterium RIFCSPLOWO2_12_FULL_62_58]|nr:MAG: hypothetical protein A3I62_01990 [Betaproteobacteria bacterium RIFCSPLOWO2_02_FULL_62_79]OGA50009.1 MAG: hypothetical protein A3F74_16275 [Betaproteobacteria bacterium RIFCSPLOWO2_12_FULL_62_58]
MTDTKRRTRVITCILQAGSGIHVLQRLRGIGIDSAFVHHARGVGASGKRRRGASHYAEREVVTVLVEARRAEEIFEFLYSAADIGKPHGGMLFLEKAGHGIPPVLPNLPDES